MALEGSFQDMSLVDLFHVFRMGPKTGLLLVNRPPERAIVYIATGSPIDAAIFNAHDQSLLAESENALLSLFAWDTATFVFQADMSVQARPQRIFRDSEELVLEGIRRRNQQAQATPSNQLTLDTRLTMAMLSSQTSQGINLNLDQWRILSQISICNTIREICTNIRMPSDEVLRVASELAAIGLIEVQSASPTLAHSVRSRAIHSPTSTLQPQLAGVGPQRLSATAVGSTAHPGKSLMGAIMRRVRGL